MRKKSNKWILLCVICIVFVVTAVGIASNNYDGKWWVLSTWEAPPCVVREENDSWWVYLDTNTIWIIDNQINPNPPPTYNIERKMDVDSFATLTTGENGGGTLLDTEGLRQSSTVTASGNVKYTGTLESTSFDEPYFGERWVTMWTRGVSLQYRWWYTFPPMWSQWTAAGSAIEDKITVKIVVLNPHWHGDHQHPVITLPPPLYPWEDIPGFPDGIQFDPPSIIPPNIWPEEDPVKNPPWDGRIYNYDWWEYLDPNDHVLDRVGAKVTYSYPSGESGYFTFEFDDGDDETENEVRRAPSSGYLSGAGTHDVSWIADDTAYEDDEWCDVCYRVVIREYDNDDELAQREFVTIYAMRPIER